MLSDIHDGIMTPQEASYQLNPDDGQDALQFKVLTYDELTATFVKQWKDLAQRSHDTLGLFQEPHWVLSWLQGFGPRKVHFVTGWRGDCLVGLLGLMERKASLIGKELVSIAHPEAGYSSLLVDNNERQEPFITALFDFAKLEIEADLIILPNTPQTSVWPEQLTKDIVVKVRSESGYAALVDTDIAGGFTPKPNGAVVSKNRSLRKKLNKLARDGDVTLETIDHKHPLAASIVDTMLDWKLDWLDKRGLEGGVEVVSGAAYPT